MAVASPEEAAVPHVARGLVGLRHQGPEASDEARVSVGEHSAMASRVRLAAVQAVVIPKPL